ncbi:TCP-1/cpn60 chaperonin family protein, partial [Chlamydia psittaci 06-1683]
IFLQQHGCPSVYL